MSKFFFYLYLVGGTTALALLVYDVLTAWPKWTATSNILLDVLPALFLFYMAYKVYHEKKDHELM